MKGEERLEFLVALSNIDELIEEIWDYLDMIDRDRELRKRARLGKEW